MQTFTQICLNKYMLLAGWVVCIVKNYEQGLLEGSIFKPEVTVFLSQTITCLSVFLIVNWLTNGFVYARLSLNLLM